MTPFDDDPTSPVSAQAARGHRSALLTQGVRLGCKAVSVVVLARLLTPAEHGLYAMAASAFLFLFLFRDLGLGTAAVQAAMLNPVQLASLFWAHAVLGGILMLIAIGAAPGVAAFYATPQVSPLLAVMSIAFLCIGLGGLPRALLARELRFESLNFVETTAAVAGTIVMLAAGAAGAGAWAFVIYLLVSEAANALLAWRACRWRPDAQPAWSGVREFARTGAHLTGFHALNYWLYQIDTIALGHALGPRSLGIYNRTGQLLGLTNLHIAGPLTQVSLSALSRLSDNAVEFRRQACATATMVAHLSLPIAAAAMAIPDEIVRLVLGAQWFEAAPIMRWLAVGTGLFTATSLAYSVNVAASQTRRLALSVVFSLPFVGLAVWLGLSGGGAGVARAVAIANLALAVPRLWWMLRGSPLRVGDYLEALAGPIVAAAALGVGLAAGRAIAADGTWGTRLLAAATGGFGSLLLLAAAWPRVRREWHHVQAHLPGAKYFTIPPSV